MAVSKYETLRCAIEYDLECLLEQYADLKLQTEKMSNLNLLRNYDLGRLAEMETEINKLKRWSKKI